MASRSKPERRPERGGDTMEAIKPLIVLVLFGTILYGAYSVVQKGSAAKLAGPADADEAPRFEPPAVELAPTQPAPTPLPAAPSEIAAANPPPPAPPPAPPPPLDALAAASVAPPAEPPPVYLAAESAPPPAQADVLPPAPAMTDAPPERLASLATTPAAVPPALSPPPQMPPAAGSLPSSAAFATAWADAHDKLTAGRYTEALTALSVWYDDPSLGLEESHRLEDLLAQLAGTVIYSQQDLLLPPHVVASGETLPGIAATLGVSWQLLAKINGVADPMQLVPGEHLKLVRGPFDAVVSISRRRLSLQIGGAYAGSFPVVVGRQFLARAGSAVQVADIRRAATSADRFGIILSDGLSIEAAAEPALVPDDAAPASLILSVRDLAELCDILGPGSSVLVRQ